MAALFKDIFVRRQPARIIVSLVIYLLLLKPLSDLAFPAIWFIFISYFNVYKIFSPDFLEEILLTLGLFGVYHAAIIAQAYAFQPFGIRLVRSTNKINKTRRIEEIWQQLKLNRFIKVSIAFYLLTILILLAGFDADILLKPEDKQQELYILYASGDLSSFSNSHITFGRSAFEIFLSQIAWHQIVLYFIFFIGYCFITPLEYIIGIQKYIFRIQKKAE
ncbi:hypothetical protein LJB99_04900 [Deltaproteobacteria bacterium OttesenSCG-928-K17]|nr:hypothetical protein [Deltaproteobacteria bacterium OttesenSCG-928-K17]